MYIIIYLLGCIATSIYFVISFRYISKRDVTLSDLFLNFIFSAFSWAGIISYVAADLLIYGTNVVICKHK